MSDKVAKFLIVEDNELDVEKLSRGFDRLNIANKVVHAGNGYEALDILRGENGRTKLARPYVIFLDLNMPRMNGLEFLEAIRADESLVHSPVFVMTTSDRQKDVESAFAHNVCGYIVKPVRLDQMFDALSTLNLFWNLSELPLGQVTA